jgi:hypothetical protein
MSICIVFFDQMTWGPFVNITLTITIKTCCTDGEIIITSDSEFFLKVWRISNQRFVDEFQRFLKCLFVLG